MKILSWSLALIGVAVLLALPGCVVEKRTSHSHAAAAPPSAAPAPAPPPPAPAGPPAHAQAHGYRARHQYVYYPNSCVYYDSGRKMYFYLEAGSWKMGASLPAGIRLDVGGAVTLEMETDKPYVEFNAHKGKYPPGQAKKEEGHPGKGKAKGKDK